MRRPLAMALAGLCLAAAGCAQDETVQVPAPSAAAPADGPSGFGARSIWRTPLPDDAELEPASERLVAGLVRQVEDAGPYLNTARYSTPVVTAEADTPTVRIPLTEGTPALRRAFARVPLPTGARPAPGKDRHLVIVQPSRDRMWELFGMRRVSGRWQAIYGGRMDDVSKGVGVYGGARRLWGATATSLPLLGGLIRLDEARAGNIPHALALEVPKVTKDVVRWPAQRTDGNSTSRDALPEGTWLRLDPAVDVEALSLPPLVTAMARAAQRYGIVVRDRSDSVSFEGEQVTAPDGGDRWSSVLGGRGREELLSLFPWSRLQVVTPDARRANVSSG